MRKIIFTILGCLGFISTNVVFGQTFSVPNDTVSQTWSPNNTAFYNKITNTGSTPISIRWQVVSSSFPSDWASGSALGICDNHVCYYNIGDTALWNTKANASGFSNVTDTIMPGATANFNLSLDLSNATFGIHYINVLLSSGGYSKMVTYTVNYGQMATPTVPLGANDVYLYPNPANNEVNMIYGANADVKTIAVYNILGKVMAVYKVSGNSANLDIENFSSGIYFARLISSQGEVVVTRKFTKE